MCVYIYVYIIYNNIVYIIYIYILFIDIAKEWADSLLRSFMAVPSARNSGFDKIQKFLGGLPGGLPKNI